MQGAPRPPIAPAAPDRRYGGLRLFAATCVASAWITLVLSLLLGLSLLLAPAPGLGALPVPPQSGLDPNALGGGLGPGGLGGGGLGAGGMGALLPSIAGALRWVGALTTIGGGVLSFFLLAAIGQAIYVLLDMEENTRLTAAAMAHIARRMGS